MDYGQLLPLVDELRHLSAPLFGIQVSDQPRISFVAAPKKYLNSSGEMVDAEDWCWKMLEVECGEGVGKDENLIDLEMYCFQLETLTMVPTWVRDISKIEALSCFTLGKIIRGWQTSCLQSHWMISRFAGHGLVSANQHSWPSLGFVLWWVW